MAGLSQGVPSLERFVEAETTQRFIVAVIVINAVVIGLETWPAAVDFAGPLLVTIDRLALAIFVVELAAKLVVYRFRFFRSGWNVFDFVIVAVALVPAGEGVSILRALRILRAMRLLSVMPEMRRVVHGLFRAVPAMWSVILLLGLLFYISSVLATKLFGNSFPDWFGSVGHSLYSLFQIMTLESWSMGIVRPVMELFPLAWLFFVPFVLLTSFIVLNLFIAIIVNAMHEEQSAEETQRGEDLVREIVLLREEVSALRQEHARLCMDPSQPGAAAATRHDGHSSTT